MFPRSSALRCCLCAHVLRGFLPAFLILGDGGGGGIYAADVADNTDAHNHTHTLNPLLNPHKTVLQGD
tara:strand:+ start:314 stop:517 length:204 start_codon:yes stop_codon:yes gene_type:complete